VVPGGFTAVVIGACAIATVVLGVVPSWGLDLLRVTVPFLS